MALNAGGEHSSKSLHPEDVREERDVPSHLYVPKLYVASKFYSSWGSRERRNRSKHRRRRKGGCRSCYSHYIVKKWGRSSVQPLTQQLLCIASPCCYLLIKWQSRPRRHPLKHAEQFRLLCLPHTSIQSLHLWEATSPWSYALPPGSPTLCSLLWWPAQS